MGLGELGSRIFQSGAKAAIVISMWRGNPGELLFIDSQGRELATIRIESALLRRETFPSGKLKVTSLMTISTKTDSPDSVRALATLLQKTLDLPVEYHIEPPITGILGQCILWLESTPSGKIIWTHYHGLDGAEIGPRIRIKDLRSTEL